jgi:hypothetical protein
VYRGLREPYVDKVVGGVWDLKSVIGGTEERAAVQSVESTWLRKSGGMKVFKGHVLRRRGDRRSFVTAKRSDKEGHSDYVTRRRSDKRSLSDHVTGKGSDENVTATTWLEEEEMKEVLVTMFLGKEVIKC